MEHFRLGDRRVGTSADVAPLRDHLTSMLADPALAPEPGAAAYAKEPT